MNTISRDFKDEMIVQASDELISYFTDTLHLEPPFSRFWIGEEIDITIINTPRGEWFITIVGQDGYCKLYRTRIEYDDYREIVRILGDQYHGPMENGEVTSW